MKKVYELVVFEEGEPFITEHYSTYKKAKRRIKALEKEIKEKLTSEDYEINVVNVK